MIMGIQHWGAFGGFQKKTGALVGHWVNGQNVITAVPHPSLEPPTVKQLDVRAKFRLVQSFVLMMGPLVKTGYEFVRKEKQSAMNAAFSYNYRNALTGVSPNFVMDYPKVVYSRGMLSEAYNPEVATTVPAELTFSWLNEFSEGFGDGTDRATVMAYNPAKDKFVFKTGAVARSALTYTLLVPGDFAGDNVHCYMSFVTMDGKRVSESVYVGMISVM